jgi:hypothetical protein
MIRYERDQFDRIEDLLKLYRDAVRRRDRLAEEFKELNTDRKKPYGQKVFFDIFTRREYLQRIAKKQRISTAAAARIRKAIIKAINKI